MAGRPPTVRSMPRKKRDAPVSYRPPENLREEFHARAVNSGLTINAFITRAVFGQAAPRTRRVSSLDQQLAAQLLSQAARINDRLQSATISPDLMQVALLQACRDELTEIRTCLMHVLGREP